MGHSEVTLPNNFNTNNTYISYAYFTQKQNTITHLKKRNQFQYLWTRHLINVFFLNVSTILSVLWSWRDPPLRPQTPSNLPSAPPPTPSQPLPLYQPCSTKKRFHEGWIDGFFSDRTISYPYALIWYFGCFVYFVYSFYD